MRFEEFKPKANQGRVPTERWFAVHALRRLFKFGRSDKGPEGGIVTEKRSQL